MTMTDVELARLTCGVTEMLGATIEYTIDERLQYHEHAVQVLLVEVHRLRRIRVPAVTTCPSAGATPIVPRDTLSSCRPPGG